MFFRVPAWGYVNISGPGTPTTGGIDLATNNWVSTVNGLGGSVSALQISRIDELIIGLKAAGLWSKMDLGGIWAGEADPYQAKLNLNIGSQLAFPAGAPTLNWQGYHDSAGVKMIDTTLNPSTMPLNYALNGASLGVYLNYTSGSSADEAINIGAGHSTGAAEGQLSTTNFSGSFAHLRAKLNNLTDHDAPIPGTLPIPKNHFYVVSRTAGTGSNNVACYMDGVQLGSSFSSNSIALPDVTFAVMTNHDGSGSYSVIDRDPYSFGWIGGPLNSTEVAALSTLVLNYLAYYNVRPSYNILGKSQEFDQSPWGASTNVDVSPVSVTAPDGTTGVHKVRVTGATSFEQLGQTNPMGGTVTGSIYVKNDGWTWVQMRLYSGTIDAYAWFNIATGALGTPPAAGATYSITSVGGGWYRLSVTTLDPVIFRISPVDNDNDWNMTPVGTNGILVWGAQLEPGAVASGYNRNIG